MFQCRIHWFRAFCEIQWHYLLAHIYCNLSMLRKYYESDYYLQAKHVSGGRSFKKEQGNVPFVLLSNVKYFYSLVFIKVQRAVSDFSFVEINSFQINHSNSSIEHCVVEVA